MTDPLREPRSFQPRAAAMAKEAWPELIDGWDAVRASAMVQRVRWHTGLKQKEFAEAFHIDPERLRALERGVERADAALLAYLTVIDHAPEAVRSALSGE